MPKSAQNKLRQKKLFSLLLGFGISFLCLYWLFSSIELDVMLGKLREAEADFLFSAVLATVLSYLLRSLRWVYFFDKQCAPSFAKAFYGLIYGFFMNNVLPARMGELVRAHVGGRLTGLSRAHVLATIAAERLADGLLISLIFAGCYLTNSKAIYHHQGLLYVAYLFLFASLSLTLIFWQQQRFFILLQALLKKLPKSFSNYSLERVELFFAGLAPLYQFKRFFLISFFSFLIWAVELLVYHQVARAYGQELPLAGLSIFLVAVNFSSLIPAAPGGIGVIEAFATFILTKVGIAKETAFAMVASQHLIQILVVGLPGAFVQVKYFGSKLPAASAEDVVDDSGFVSS